MSNQQRILDYLADADVPSHISLMREVLGMTAKQVDQAMHQMMKRGAVVRTAPGTYCLPEKQPAADAETLEDVIEIPPALEMAIWHTGELTLRRADDALVLMPAEVAELVTFLRRVSVAGDAA